MLQHNLTIANTIYKQWHIHTNMTEFLKKIVMITIKNTKFSKQKLINEANRIKSYSIKIHHKNKT